MKLLVNESKPYLEGVLGMIDTVMGFNYKGTTKTYSYIMEHPTNGLFGMIVRDEDLITMANSFPTELEQIGSELVAQLVDYTSDWKTQEEIV